MDKQPLHGESIIQIDAPYEGHYCMGMRSYDQNCTWEEILQFRKENDLGNPNFWWISAKDFPFPDEDKKSAEYFMTKMTQEEFDEIRSPKIENLNPNMIKRELPKQEP